MNLNQLFHCVVLITLGLGCDRKTSDTLPMSKGQINLSVGRNLNPLRRQLGLRVIGEDWVLYRSDAKQEDWKITSSGALAKAVLKDGLGNVVSESDSYYSGKEFEGPDGHDWENIGVIYDFRTKEIVVSYAGPNKTTEAILSKYAMTINGGSTNVAEAIAAVNSIVSRWPSGAK